jgi:hypothetical protein
MRAGARSTEGGKEQWGDGEMEVGGVWVESGKGGGLLNVRYFVIDGSFKANGCLMNLGIFAGVG